MPTSRQITAHRAALGIAIAATMLLIWLSLGVGIIGKDGDPANRMYLGVVAVGLIGAFVGRVRDRAMALTMTAMALAQAIVGTIALIGGLGRPYSGPAELLELTAMFVAMFGASAWLFLRAARA